jgi:hypothetical protein
VVVDKGEFVGREIELAGRDPLLRIRRIRHAGLGLAANKNGSHGTAVCEEKSMFAWRSLDPKMTAQVILSLAQRFSREAPRPPKTIGWSDAAYVSLAGSAPRLRSKRTR